MSLHATSSDASLSTAAGFTRGMYWVVFHIRKAMIPNSTIGSHVMMKSAMSFQPCGIGTMSTHYSGERRHFQPCPAGRRALTRSRAARPSS